MTNRLKILWIPHTGWHIPQRAHLFCRALAERHEVHVTDWVADFSTPRDYLSRRYLRNFTYRRYMDGKIKVHGIPRFSPALFLSSLRRLNTAIFSNYVQRIITEYKIDAVVGTFVVPPQKAPRLIFDLFDDNVAIWQSFGQMPSYALEIERTEKLYLEKADAVVTVSSVLADKVRRLGARGPIFHIPNGVDLALFRDVDGKSLREKLGIEGTLVGVIGNHDKSGELQKIIKLAEIFNLKNISFLIAGRGSAIPAAMKQVRQEGLSNIYFTGYVPPNEIPKTVSAMDIGLCPYDKTPGDDARSPMRLLVYSAAGIPVVSTDLEEVRRMNFSNVVPVSGDVESIAEGIKRALQLPRKQPPQIISYDMRHLVERFETVLIG